MTPEGARLWAAVVSRSVSGQITSANPSQSTRLWNSRNVLRTPEPPSASDSLTGTYHSLAEMFFIWRELAARLPGPGRPPRQMLANLMRPLPLGTKRVGCRRILEGLWTNERSSAARRRIAADTSPLDHRRHGKQSPRALPSCLYVQASDVAGGKCGGGATRRRIGLIVCPLTGAGDQLGEASGGTPASASH